MTQNIWTNEFNPFNKYKVLCWHPRMQRIQTGDFAAPVNIALDIVQGTGTRKKCAGLQCNFCMSDLEDRGEEARVPREILFDIPRFYREWGVLSVCLAGHHSDPLAYNHDDLCHFLRLMYKNDVEVGLVSNGVLLNEFLIQDITRNCKWSGFSVNAGTSKTFYEQTGKDAFNKIVTNISYMTKYVRDHKLNHPVGYKFLITDSNHTEILEAIEVAKEIGCRQIQIRPCELPEERIAKIDVKAVEEQIMEGLQHEIPGVFEVFGIREKFTPTFRKKPPKRCIATPLGSTWKADGDIVICPDRRWSAHRPNMVLGNFIQEGLESIRRKWGGPEHLAMIRTANEHLGECIRCTSLMWHNLYENTVAEDPMDIRLI